MKNAKRLLALLLTMLFILSAAPFVTAANVQTDVTAVAGETVAVTLTYENIQAIKGSYTLSGDNIVTAVAVEAVGLDNGKQYDNLEVNTFGYAGAAAGTCQIIFTFDIDANAVAGSVQVVTFEYESSENDIFPDEPVYETDVITITIVEETPEVDYTELEKQIAIAEEKDQDLYTDESWEDLEDALAVAKAARTSQDQAVVDAAAEALKNAIAALEEKPVAPEVDYTELNKQIDIANGLNEDEYTAESWDNMQKALADAYEAKNSQDQAVVDAAAEALKNAIAALEKKPVAPEVDYTELNKQIGIAEGLKEDEYTADSWAKMEAALADAIAARESKDQAVVDAAAEALKNAIAALEKKPVAPEVDYTELNKQIGIAEGLKEDEYTADSWAKMEAALTDAIAARESKDQAVVDAAAEALKNAIAALEKKPVVPAVDYTKLNEQIAIAEGLNKDDYTAESWANLVPVLADAIAARKSDSQAEVDAATAALKAAIAALQKKPVAPAVDYTELNKQIAIAEGLNEKEYTKESWANLETALEAAYEARNAKDQATVDAAADALKDAIAALKNPPTGDALIALYTILALCVLIGGAALALSKKKKTMA